MRMHKSVTPERIMEAVHRRNYSVDNPGFCITCGNEQGNCEPDAREYECEACGEDTVYGAEELLMDLF